MVTAGQTPPPFQSTYPLAQVALPSSHFGTKLKPSHATITSPPSISVRFDDLTTIWLYHSQLDLYRPAEQTGCGFEIATDTVPGTFVKVEVSPTDNLPPPSDHRHDHPSRNHHSPASLQFDLPPLYVYYPSATFPLSPSSAMIQLQQTQSSHYSSSSSPNSSLSHHAGPSTGFPPSPTPPPSLPKPAASAALFSFLPSPPTRIKLLNRARIAHPHIALVTPWNRLVALADPSSKDEKAKRTALANAVFFNASRTVESPASIRAQVPSSFMASKTSALPIFISLCYALALGALETDESPPVDPAFLHALAGQALGVWEEFWTSDTIKGRDETREREGRGRKKGGLPRDELDYLVACLLQVKYMLRLGSSATGQGGVTSALETVFPLVCLLLSFPLITPTVFLDRKTSESGAQSRPRS